MTPARLATKSHRRGVRPGSVVSTAAQMGARAAATKENTEAPIRDSTMRCLAAVQTMSAALGLACGSSPADPRIVERDSAGIRIVESTMPFWQKHDVWQLTAEPTLDIGSGTTEKDQLYRVQGAIRFDDGTIVIANAGSSQLRYYGPSGEYLGAGGREGSGPGEFAAGSGPWTAWRAGGDSVGAWDIANRRLSVFDDRGRFGRSVTLLPESRRFPDVIGLLSDDRMVTVDVASEPGDHPIGTVYRGTFRYDVYGADGAWLAAVAELPAFERLVYEWTGRKTSGTGPFGRLAWTAVWNDVFHYTSADAFEVFRVDLQTDSTSIFRALTEPTSVTNADIGNYKAERVANAPDDPAGRQAWQRWLDEVPYPASFPTFRGLQVDAVDHVWAELYNVPLDSVPKWMVFDARGRWLGTVTMPKGFTPQDIGDTYVLGRWRDVDEVEHVRLYDLLKPS